MKEIIYYLFGGEISKLYHDNENFLEIVRYAKENGDFAICKFDPNKHEPSQLLNAYDGWGGFAEITKTEFMRLHKLDNVQIMKS